MSLNEPNAARIELDASYAERKQAQGKKSEGSN
jgi:hypothetical protein